MTALWCADPLGPARYRLSAGDGVPRSPSPATAGRRIRTFRHAGPAPRARSNGYLVEDARAEEIPVTVHAVLRGAITVTPPLTRRLAEPSVRQAPASAAARRGRPAALTGRDREVLVLVTRGVTDGRSSMRLHGREEDGRVVRGEGGDRQGVEDLVEAEPRG
ncbi:hypothetical protein PYK79_15725 [Streptomyces sp. ID05-04B]|nr:hypothetical protein [Streptomyces sp. ID05-04B]